MSDTFVVDSFFNNGVEFPAIRVSGNEPFFNDLPDEVAGLIQNQIWNDYNNDGFIGITFSFNDNSNPNFRIPNAFVQADIRAVLEEIDALTNLRFEEIDRDAIIDFSIEPGLLEQGFLGFAFFPFVRGTRANFDDGGDIRNTILVQEILHTLGLQGTEEDFLALPDLEYPREFDTPLWSNLQTEVVDLATIDSTGLLPLDFEGLIAIYGDSGNTAGDDVYTYDTSVFYFEGLHDSGGIDTVQVLDSMGVGVSIDLTDLRGSFDLGAVAGIRDNPFDNFEAVGALVNTTRFTVIENLITDRGEDRLLGGAVDNFFQAGAGADTLEGEGGADILFGDLGSDSVRGGVGSDTLIGAGDDDFLHGGKGRDVLFGGSGDDSLIGGAGADFLYGQTGFDSASYAASDEAISIDLITGFGVGGHADGDQLFGIEQIEGSSFADSLTAGAGQTRLFGGAGADTFRFTPGGDLEVADYSPGEGDSLDLTEIGFSSVNEATDFARQTGEGLLFDFGDEGTLLLSGATLADI